MSARTSVAEGEVGAVDVEPAGVGISVAVTGGATDGTTAGALPVPAAAAAATAVADDDGCSTVSTPCATPFVASIFLAWTDTPFTLRPFESENVSSSPVNANRVGAPPMFAAITFSGRMWYDSSALSFV